MPGTISSKPSFDLLAVPLVGRFLKWRYARPSLQSILLVVAVLMVIHGLAGPQLAPKNLATLLTWVHYRGLLVGVLLVAGNFFCMACPFMLLRDLARRFHRPVLNWPRRLRSKGLSIVLLVLVLFAYENFDLWGSPWWTAWLIAGYFLAAVLIDVLFKNASFCKYVCPIGQFNFAASTVSPLEVAVKDPVTCSTCTTHDCIRGTRSPENPALVLQRGCELALFQPSKVGNLDCTFCLDCVHACPHDNIVMTTRMPGSELWSPLRRSGIGSIDKRTDLSILAIVFLFAALLNAFGMVSPVYAFLTWLSRITSFTSETSVLGLLFLLALILEPVLLLGVTAVASRRLSGVREGVLPVVYRFAFGLIPLGFGIWVAHYGFHLLTGFLTFVPVFQDLFYSAGFPLFGKPAWQLGGLSEALVYPMELGFLGLGTLGSMMVTYRIAERDYPQTAIRTFIPWAVLLGILLAAALWLLSQPMEMRGTFLGT